MKSVFRRANRFDLIRHSCRRCFIEHFAQNRLFVQFDFTFRCQFNDENLIENEILI